MPEVQELPASVTQVKKELTTPRDISKKHDPEGRSALAATIIGARKEGRSIRNSITKQDQLSQKTRDQYFALGPNEEQAAENLAQRNESRLVKLKAKLGIGDQKASDLQEQLATVQGKRATLSVQSAQAAYELQPLQERQANIPDPKEMLKAYYEKMEIQPLTNQEKRELLTPEVLESLTTEEYIVLWRRLNPHFLSHVTRQGFRDHNAMIYHSAGLAEFHNGFVEVLEDGKQNRPPLALDGLRTRDEESVRQFLSRWVLEAPNQEEALERFNARLHHTLASAPSYPDKTAVHFAAQVVADDYYGGEDNNEVFFLYPTDTIVSQHNFAFNGWGKDFTTPQNERKWNDIFIWPNTVDNPGITVDTGFVFLPENIPVDPKTGSKYASEVKIVDGKKQRMMIEDTKLVDSFVSWVKGLGKDSPIIQAHNTYTHGYRDQDRRDYLTVVAEEVHKLGINPEDSATIAEDNSLRTWLTMVSQDSEVTDQAWASILRNSNANWKRPEQTILAKQYWENYFTQNPHLKPKHVVYYDGDPTTAVYKFQQKNNIGKADTSDSEGQLLGFDDHHVTDLQTDPRANKGLGELVEMGNKIIVERYKGQGGIAA